MTAPIPAALDAADVLAEQLADPATAWGGARPEDPASLPQSLPGGAAGIALLHIERARAGRADWATARRWLAEAGGTPLTAAENAFAYFGAPALATVLNLAAHATGRYRSALAQVNQATITLTRRRLAEAAARLERAELPPLREFDLVRGLAGLGTYHLSHHPTHPITTEVLDYLARLTDPLPGLDPPLPPWWTPLAPNGEHDPAHPGGHGNLGVSHGISSVISVLSLALLRGHGTSRSIEALERLCGWSDLWRQHTGTGTWWPAFITAHQHRAGHLDQRLRPRPSWCYGVAGTARAQQLAGLALRDPKRVAEAHRAILAALTDPAHLDLLTEPGLCHGTAGLLHCTWRIAADSTDPAIAAHLPRLASRVTATLTDPRPGPGLLDGTAGVALALLTAGSGTCPNPPWDTALALA